MGGACTSAQARNIALCCQLQEVHRALAAQLARLPAPAAAALRYSLISSQLLGSESHESLSRIKQRSPTPLSCLGLQAAAGGAPCTCCSAGTPPSTSWFRAQVQPDQLGASGF